MFRKEFEEHGFEVRMTPSSPFILEGTKNKLYLLFEILAKEKKEQTTNKTVSFIVDKVRQL